MSAAIEEMPVKPSVRVMIAGVLLELALAGLAWYLTSQLRSGAMQPSGTLEEAVTTILQVIGGVMGGLGGLLIVVFFVLRRKESSS